MTRRQRASAISRTCGDGRRSRHRLRYARVQGGPVPGRTRPAISRQTVPPRRRAGRRTRRPERLPRCRRRSRCSARRGGGGRDRASSSRPPLRRRRPSSLLPRSPAHLRPGGGGENGEPDPCCRQQIQGLDIDRSLRKPHPFGLPAEPCREIAHTPPGDLDLFIPPGRKRHDGVVVAAGDRGPVAAVAFPALAVGDEDRTVDLRVVPLEPGKKRRCGRETDPCVVVHEFLDQPVGVEDACGGVRGVALCGHPLVPVVVRRGGTLHFDLSEPGFSRAGW